MRIRAEKLKKEIQGRSEPEFFKAVSKFVDNEPFGAVSVASFASNHFACEAAVEVGHQMCAKVTGIVASAIDQRGFSAAHKLRTHQVHAWRRNNAAIMPDPAFAVENGNFKPGVIGAIAGGPDDRCELGSLQIHAERRRRLNSVGDRRGRPARCGVEAVLMRPFVDRSRNVPILRSERAHWLRNEPENCVFRFAAYQPAPQPASPRSQ